MSLFRRKPQTRAANARPGALLVEISYFHQLNGDRVPAITLSADATQEDVEFVENWLRVVQTQPEFHTFGSQN